MAASGSGPLGRGLDISLAALRRQDPYIRSIVDVASQVALYTFSHKANEWEKTDVEGTLFVYTRSASPKHGFTIMNRLSIENRTEPITKDLDFQLQDPFLLYRNARFFIYGIWFYDKEECQRIAELMKNLTQQEQMKAQQSASVELSPMILPSEAKEVDILQMLTKAKDEYTKPGDHKPQHLSLTTLFGKPKTAEGTDHKDPPAGRPPVVRSLSYEELGQTLESCDKQLCPAIQKLLVRGADLHPVSTIPENQHCPNGTFHPPGDVFSGLFLPVEDTSQPVPDLESGESLLHMLQGPYSTLPPPDRGHPATAHSGGARPASGKVTGNTPLGYYDHSQQSQRTVPLIPLSSQPPPSSGAISPQELLKKLNLVRQDQQYQTASKPALAAKFPVVSQSAQKPSWGEKLSAGEKHNPLLQVISPQRIPATVSPSLLISPMVFSQSSAHSRSGDATRHPLPANLLLPMSLTDTPTNSSVLTKSQLQGALLHLIQNDENFLNTIYETYLSVLSKGASTSRKF
ncbi:mRNA-decapping enzyme 1B isoform X3 [Mixophyes fleayi]|uniref:mRNA-decapping enzyme 1B isoform X3 n=1 Tax=Mixophyes fleayi TaxID=3061075 RepID=UPI003F4DD8BA